MPRVPHKKNKK